MVRGPHRGLPQGEAEPVTACDAMQDERRLACIGVLWKSKPDSKSLGSSSITVNGLRQRFVILRNDRKEPDSQEANYLLMSSAAGGFAGRRGCA